MIKAQQEKAENITSYIKDIHDLHRFEQRRWLAQRIKESWIKLLEYEFISRGISHEEVTKLLKEEV